MADKKISELSDGGLPQVGDKFLIARSGDNFNIDGGVLATASQVQSLSSRVDGVGLVANAAQAVADRADLQANTAYVLAGAAQGTADSAWAAANSAALLAGTAYTQANTATTAAGAASNLAGSAFTQANTAYTQANTALALAGSSFTQANAAYSLANTVNNTVSAAYNQANAAYTRANSAYSLAQTTSNTVSNMASPTVFLHGTSSQIAAPYMAHPNSIPAWNSFGQFNASANTAVTFASAFYTQQNVQISSFEIQIVNVNGSSRTVNWQLAPFDPALLTLGGQLYGGKAITVSSAGRIQDQVDGVIGPGWYAVLFSVATGTALFSGAGVPSVAKYSHAYAVGSSVVMATGSYQMNGIYYPPQTVYGSTSMTSSTAAVQIPFNWVYTTSAPRAFQSNPGGGAG